MGSAVVGAVVWSRTLILTILVAVSSTLVLLLAGGLTTKIDSWYRDLRKPAWTPPNWLFGPAWTLILGLAAVSGVRAWTGAELPESHAWIALTFGANAVFHLIWSPLFFRLKRPDLALVDVACLWMTIVGMIWAAGAVSRIDGWLLVPYLLWVSYAAALNLSIVRLNSAGAVSLQL